MFGALQQQKTDIVNNIAGSSVRVEQPVGTGRVEGGEKRESR